MTHYSIVVVGATGLVGSTLLNILQERNFPIKTLYLTASQQSMGKDVLFGDQTIRITDLATFDFHRTNIAFFCVGNALASEYIPKAVAAKNLVIDKSFFYRNDPAVPLIIPEVNSNALLSYPQVTIIASPNCNTIPIAVALKPIYDQVGIRRVNVSTYQSVSGNGREAMVELTEQSQQLLKHQPIHPKIFSQQIAFNVLPHIDDFQENGYTREEMKIVWEMRKIFNDPKLAINPTAVRVPVFCGHAASVHVETEEKITAKQAVALLSKAPGVSLVSGEYPYPTPAQHVVGKDPVYIGRIREDISHQKGLNLWIVADNLRKGAALNAIQIAEFLIKNQMVEAKT